MTALAPSRPSLSAVFRHRNYRLFFAGQVLSLAGTWMQAIAQAWLVHRLTGSPAALGLVVFAQQGPIFFLAAIGGALADRFDRRRVIMIAQVLNFAQAAALAALTFSGLATFDIIVLLALLSGLVNAVEIPVRQAFTVEMVGKQDLQAAIALNGIMFNLARVGGPAVAGLVVAAVGEAWCFTVNAVSFGAVLLSLVLMRVAPRPARAFKRPLEELAEGFRYLRGHAEIRQALGLLALSSFAGGPYLALMPVMVEQVLGQGSVAFGVMMSAVGLGALFGAFAMSRLTGERLAAAPALAAAGFGVALMLFAQSSLFWLSLLLVLPTAFGLMMQGSATNSIVQSLVADEMRGRVMAYFTMSFIGMLPIGALAAGFVADMIGVRWTLTLGGLVSLAGGLYGLLLARRAAAALRAAAAAPPGQGDQGSG